VYYKQSAANDALSTPEIVILQSDGVTPYTSTFAAGEIKLSKGGGAFGNIHCTPAHLEDGVWKIPLDATDKDTIGTLVIKIKKSGVQTTVLYIGSVVAWDPADGAGLGLTNLNATVGSRSTQTSVDTVAGYIDTEVAAIKAQTDQLLFSAAGNLRAAMNEVNSQNAAASTTVPKRLTAAGEFKVMDSTGAAIATASSITTLSSDSAAGLVDLQSRLTAIDDYVDTEVAAIKAKTDALPSDPADASDIAASFATTAATLATIAGYLDTEIAAIKAKTDQLVFTIANQVDANALTGGGGGGASAADVVDELEARVYEDGLGTPASPDRTYKGLFRRLSAMIENATGLKGSTVQLLAPDGTVLAIIPQTAQGASHSATDVSGSEA
jgi:cell division protein ZapA (FtsZ GTPase activity inhibitor)